MFRMLTSRAQWGVIFLQVPLLALLATIASAQAACGKGAVPTYADIDAIRFAHTNCFGKCGSYDVTLSRDGFHYVGGPYAPRRGTYEANFIPSIYKRAVNALRLHDFFSLNYDSSVLVTDAPHLIVSAQRCGVTTKLDWPQYTRREDIESLFEDLQRITGGIRWHKIGTDENAPNM